MTELQPFELSHFRQLFALKGIEFSSYSFFYMDHFETLHTCCGYIEDVYVNFCRRKNNFSQNYSIFDFAQPGFAGKPFETLHRCYKHNEDICAYDF